MNFHNLAAKYLQVYDIAKSKLNARVSKKKVQGYISSKNVLTTTQEKQVQAFWGSYAQIDPVFHAFYWEKSGRFCPEFIPTDLYYTKIDPFFNPSSLGRVLDNKCLYTRLFPGIPQADNILYRLGGFWFNKDWQMLSINEVLQILADEPAVVMKPATASVCGMGVRFIEGTQQEKREQFSKELEKQSGDIVVQRPFHQHKSFEALHSASVNTLRIVTLLTEDGPKVYSVVVRMGGGGERIDNAVATGLFCGVGENGELSSGAYRLNGNRYEKHPTSGLVFEGHRLAGVPQAKQLVLKAATFMPVCRFVAWDVVVDESGEPHMLECNLSKGDIYYHQLTNGPIFGEDTKKILDEVFGKNK